MEYPENSSRRNNTRVEGIAKDDNATWLDTENTESKEREDKLYLEFEPDIE